MRGLTTVELLADQSVERLRIASASPYLLIAEHAGNRVPTPWHNLGLAPEFLETHFAVDIGVDKLTRRLSEEMDAPAVIGRYSRLFLDYNRPALAWDYMRPDIGGIPVPANLDVSAADRSMRDRIGWMPLEDAIVNAAPGKAALISVHSFTPVMGGIRRDVDIGVLWKRRTPLVAALLDALALQGPEAGFRIGDNEPYDWRNVTAYTLDRHGIEQDRECLYLELRNTLLSDAGTFERVARLLSRIFNDLQASPHMIDGAHQPEIHTTQTAAVRVRP